MSVKIAWLWNSSGARWPWGQASLQLDSSSLFLLSLLCTIPARYLQCFSSSQENTCGKCALRARGELAYMDRTTPPLVPDWTTLMQMKALNP